MRRTRLCLSILVLVVASTWLFAPGLVTAFVTIASSKLVTNTTGGKNQNPAIDQSGKVIVFTSNTDHRRATGTIFDPPAAFDFNGAGNGFTPPVAADPNPSCTNCVDANLNSGNLFLWRLAKKGSSPANSVRQLTFSASGDFASNQAPDISQRGNFVGWDSDRDHVAGNADGNREIFLLEVATGAIAQVTTTTGGSDAANRGASLSDDGKLLAFDSSRDLAGPACALGDGVSPCANADGNAEVVVYDRVAGRFVQVTSTSGGTGNANRRARISNDGRYVGFQSNRDFGGALPGGASCAQLDGVSPCGNADGNGEIVLFDRKENRFTQITNTVSGGGCSGTDPNERVELNKQGKLVSFQSKCEAQLNPTGCGDCDGNDEVFVADIGKKGLQQLTISKGGFNRVPRISGQGSWLVFESSRNYKGLNPSHGRAIYFLRRKSGKAPAGQTGPGQLIEDSTSPLAQNAKTEAVIASVTNGFNSTIEQFGLSGNGRFVTFDNQKSVGNQEIWRVDRNK